MGDAVSKKTISAIHHLSNELDQITPEHPMRSLLITSVKADEGHIETSFELAKQYAEDKLETLFIESDLLASEAESEDTAGINKGLIPLINKLLTVNLSEGKILDFGFNDLLHLVRIQDLSGMLIINPDSQYQRSTVFFHNGEIIDIQSPSRRCSEQPTLQNIVNDEILETIDLHSETPVLIQLLKLINKSDDQLKQFYMVDLENILDNVREQAQTFSFTETTLQHGATIGKWLNQNRTVASLPVEEHGYITQKLQHNSFEAATRLTRLPLDRTRASLILDSDRYTAIQKIMGILEQLFDKIVIQAPAPTSKTVINRLGKITDGTVMVIKRDSTSTRQLKSTIRSLLDHEVNLLGAVYNEGN